MEKFSFFMSDIDLKTSFLIVIASYLLGSIPFGLIYTAFAGLGDIRKIGSGNIGTTNVLRTGNKLLALLTLISDGGKAIIAVVITRYILDANYALIAGLFATIGHNYPIWLKFKGGKGVATTLGLILALNYVVGLLALGIWLGFALLFRYSSLAALSSIFLTTLFTYLFMDANMLSYLLTVLSILMFYKHKSNIKNLLNGSETKIGKK